MSDFDGLVFGFFMKMFVAGLIYVIYEVSINSYEQFERLLRAPGFSIILSQCLAYPHRNPYHTIISTDKTFS
jgi:hypothetical protein